MLLGFLAIRYDFWPPNCGILPVKQAKRVCEFSHLERAAPGQAAKISVWVTVPANTPPKSAILLAIEGREPLQLEKVNDTSYTGVIEAATGDVLRYRYLRNKQESASEPKELAIKSLKKDVYDAVAAWSDLKPAAALPTEIAPMVTTYDTWTINYNMNMFEDTRRNLENTMARVQAMGGKDIGIYSFIEMFGTKDDFVVQEVETPYKYYRDAAVTEKEMKRIAAAAKKYGLKTTLHYNIEADYTRSFAVSPFLNALGPSGAGGNAAEARAGAEFGRDEPKTKAWLDRYFGQLKTILLKWAGSAQTAGIDALVVSPEYRPPSAAPLESYADEQFRDIIQAMRQTFKGQIYGYAGSGEYLKDVDGIFVNCGLSVRPGASIEEMRAAFEANLKKTATMLAPLGKPVFIVLGIGSYAGAVSGKPAMEFADFNEVKAAGYQRDWQTQADAYEAFFRALAKKNAAPGLRLAGVSTAGFAWDDLMAPEYADPRYNDLGSNIRNKPAEAVWKKWMLPDASVKP